MAAKEILYNDLARQQIGIGLDFLADAVKITLGPRGRNVVLDRAFGAPTITRDGVTVAGEIELSNHFANLGAQMVKQVAQKTAELAGDGTSTATVLAQAIWTEGAKMVSAGISPMELKRGIDAAVAAVVADLKRQSRPIEGKREIAQVGLVSANGDESIGDMIADAMEKVGKEGVITLESSRTAETTLTVVEGMRLDRGFLSPYFITDTERMEVVLADAYVLLVERRVANMAELLPLLELVAKTDRALLIIADDIEGEALATLVINKIRGALKVCAIKAPGYGDGRRETLKDLAALTGATAVSDELGRSMEKLTLDDLGSVRTITIDKDVTTLVDCAGKRDVIDARVRLLERQIVEASKGRDTEALRERLGRLTGGVAILKVGAATESEMKEKKARVEDALHATRAAVEEGIVAGGGVALLRALPALAELGLPGEQPYGVRIVRRALEAPLRQIVANAGGEGAVVVERVRAGEGGYGYNAAREAYEDLIAAGVIDPTKVVRVALQNAASVAGIMLTTEAAIARFEEGGDVA